MSAPARITGEEMTAMTGAPADQAQDTVQKFVELAVQRLGVAEAVAAAKYGSPQPIDDPSREAVVMAGAIGRARAAEVDPDVARRFVAAQMEANKIVQRGLFVRWHDEPRCAPTSRPDLAREVRPDLDRIDEQLMRLLPRVSTPGCRALVGRARLRAERRLDALHRRGLARALAPLA
jgi:chorismate mutase